MANESVIGVDLGGTKVSIGKVESHRIIKHVSANITTMGKDRQILDEVIAALEDLFDPGIAGIGIGVPSIVDVEKGIVYNVQNIPSWKEVHVKEILEDRFQRPVYVNNDANCFAVGEKYFGKGKKFRNLVGVTLGTGLGAGIIIDNRLYSGPNCGAGEFGSISYRDRIIEYYSSGQFFENVHGIKGNRIYEMASKGDERSLEIFTEFGTHLGEAIKTILFAVDPEAIILGGSVCQSYPFFEKAMWEKIKTFPYWKTIDHLVIETSDQKQIAVLGAAALYYDAQKGSKL
ncbi:MAG: ROK family protein [Candidatus Aminicenantes bacterium]|nr:MAG: ROK family protein [Candidatus Aminicenantes bacterium]